MTDAIAGGVDEMIQMRFRAGRQSTQTTTGGRDAATRRAWAGGCCHADRHDALTEDTFGGDYSGSFCNVTCWGLR